MFDLRRVKLYFLYIFIYNLVYFVIDVGIDFISAYSDPVHTTSLHVSILGYISGAFINPLIVRLCGSLAKHATLNIKKEGRLVAA